MNTPVKLFFSRLIDDWKFQYEVWKTVIDWTVLVYILIPLTVVVVRQYLFLWQTTPDWLDKLPFVLIVGIIFLFAWKGTPRFFIEDADQLFLKQRAQWYGSIIKMSITYFFWKSLFVSAFLFFILSPVLLRKYAVTWHEIALLFALTLLVKFNLGIAKQMLTLQVHGFKSKLAQIIFFILAGFTFRILIPVAVQDKLLFLTVFIMLAIICLILVNKRINLKGMFLEDRAQAIEQKLKYVSIILGLSGHNVRRTGSRRKRPLLFRNSNLLFKQRSISNSLVESGIKSFLRNRGTVTVYLQVTLFGTLFVLPLPFPWQLGVLSAVAFLLASLVRSHWMEEANSEFLRLLPWQRAHKHAAAEKFIFLTTLPGILTISFFVGLKIFSWLGVIVSLPVSILLLHYLVRMMVIFSNT